MPCYTHHKYHGAHHQASVCLMRWLCRQNAFLHSSQLYVQSPLMYVLMLYKTVLSTEWLSTHCTGVRVHTTMYASMCYQMAKLIESLITNCTGTGVLTTMYTCGDVLSDG